MSKISYDKSLDELKEYAKSKNGSKDVSLFKVAIELHGINQYIEHGYDSVMGSKAFEFSESVELLQIKMENGNA